MEKWISSFTGKHICIGELMRGRTLKVKPQVLGFSAIYAY